MNKRETEKARKRMREAVHTFQKYVASYNEQAHYEDYAELTYIEDMLYGIALSLHGVADYQGPGGYERFKERLRNEVLAYNRPLTNRTTG